VPSASQKANVNPSFCAWPELYGAQAGEVVTSRDFAQRGFRVCNLTIEIGEVVTLFWTAYDIRMVDVR
jgi:hypothetical protein